MGRRSGIEPTTAFGLWLQNSLKFYDLERKAVAARSGRGRSTITQLELGVRQPSRQMVEDLARGMAFLLPKAKAEGLYQILLREGLLAAGFLPLDSASPDQAGQPSHKFAVPLSGERTMTVEVPADVTDADFTLAMKYLSLMRKARRARDKHEEGDRARAS